MQKNNEDNIWDLLSNTDGRTDTIKSQSDSKGRKSEINFNNQSEREDNICERHHIPEENKNSQKKSAKDATTTGLSVREVNN